MSLNSAAFIPFHLTLAALRRTLALLRHPRLQLAMARATCLVGSWPTKEVVVPVLPLPLSRISSLPSIPFSSLLPGRNKDRPSHRRAPMGDTSLVLL